MEEVERRQLTAIQDQDRAASSNPRKHHPCNGMLAFLCKRSASVPPSSFTEVTEVIEFPRIVCVPVTTMIEVCS